MVNLQGRVAFTTQWPHQHEGIIQPAWKRVAVYEKRKRKKKQSTSLKARKRDREEKEAEQVREREWETCGAVAALFSHEWSQSVIAGWFTRGRLILERRRSSRCAQRSCWFTRLTIKAGSTFRSWQRVFAWRLLLSSLLFFSTTRDGAAFLRRCSHDEEDG